MDMCDACTDKQQWLLESGDGSQVICLCQIDVNSQVEDNMQNNDEIPTTIDVGVQTSETTDRQQSLFKANVESQIKAECKNCRSKFSRPDSLKRHQNYSCKIKNNGGEESQQSQLETGDGDSQVQDGDMVGVSQSDIAVQTPKRMTSPINIRTPPLKRSSPSIPNAPKRVRKMSNIPIDEEYEDILKQKIFATNPDLFNDKYFNEEIEINKTNIEDKTRKGKMSIEVNKRLSNDFTYKDLKDEILQAYLDVSKGRRMKFNIRFGLLLQNIVTKKYRYDHVSTNDKLLILDGKIIITRSDIKTIIKEIYNKNIAGYCHNAWLLPTYSGWTIVSITNAHFELCSSLFLKEMWYRY